MPRSASSIRHIVRNLKLEYEGCSLEDIIRDRKIILLYIDDLEVDGAYGNNTAAAVKAYQKANNLTIDGKAGKNTITKLGFKWEG